MVTVQGLFLKNHGTACDSQSLGLRQQCLIICRDADIANQRHGGPSFIICICQ